MDKLRAFASQLSAFWTNLSGAKRFALIAAVMTVLAGVLLVAGVGSKINYGYLYTDLNPDDAGSIVEKLKERKIPYEVSGGGTSIMVPQEQVHELRLSLASEGLPRGGGVGFEVFDKTDLGATEFEQQVKLRRALEGELARSISTLEGVKGARVHLVLPERKLFARKSEAASASVVIRLANGASFGKREVAGIVHLVSAAVPGLTHDRISVVSTDGVTLHRPNSDGSGAGALAESQADRARELARTLEAEVRTLLERVVGLGNADVMISVELDTSTSEHTEEHYEPTRTALRSEQESVEKTANGEAGVAGIPGARTALPDGAPAEEDPENAPGLVRRSHTKNWEVDRVTKKTLRPAGEIKRLSIGVLVNGKWEEKDGNAAYSARSKEELAALGAVVKQAVGFSEERGDGFHIETAAFARPDAEPPAVPVPPYMKYKLPVIAGAAGLVGLTTLIVAWRIRKARKLAKAKAAAEAKAKAETEAKAKADEERREAEALMAAEELKQLTEGKDSEYGEVARAEALSIAAQDPATAAVVLRRWLALHESSDAAQHQ